jgi:hypothetical protein
MEVLTSVFGSPTLFIFRLPELTEIFGKGDALIGGKDYQVYLPITRIIELESLRYSMTHGGRRAAMKKSVPCEPTQNLPLDLGDRKPFSTGTSVKSVRFAEKPAVRDSLFLETESPDVSILPLARLVSSRWPLSPVAFSLKTLLLSRTAQDLTPRAQTGRPKILLSQMHTQHPRYRTFTTNHERL